MTSNIQPTHHPESNLKPFLSPTFSPIDYLNATLPSATTTHANSNPPPPSLTTLASQTQTQISTLTAQSTRLSKTLTALTDEILRASPRLAYEVELLRGDTRSLVDSLSPTGDLHPAISQFVPEGLTAQLLATDPPKEEDDAPPTTSPAATAPLTNEPNNKNPPINPLRTLLQVRARLTTVSKTFSLALSWPIPPSLLTSPSLISVSAPADPTLEAKGQAACARLRQEIINLLAEDGDQDGAQGEDGITRAEERVGELRECVGVWKGTGEEKARGRFVDGLEGLVEEEKRRRRGRRSGDGREGNLKADHEDGKSTATSVATAARSGGAEVSSGPGFLRRLRDEIYME